HHGPITHRLGDEAGELAGRWVATKINWDPVNALRQSYLRTKTSGYEDFLEVMQIRTNSSNNTVYADSSGNIAYFHGNFVPRRDPSFDFQRPVDGSDPRTDWQGLHEVAETVTLLNPETGWLQNANSTPFTAAGPASPRQADYPVYMAPDFENFRGVQAVRLLEQADDVTLDSLIELAYHPGLPAFEVLIPSLVEAWDRSGAGGPHGDLKEAIEVLRVWDHQVAADSVAMSLAHFYGAQVLRHGDIPDTVRGRLHRIEHFAAESPDAERLGHLAAVVAQLEADFGDWQTPWGEINRFQRLDGRIDSGFDDAEPSLPVAMASGRWGALASYGARAKDTKRIYGVAGNSFVAVVEFGDRVQAKSLLAGGQSGDPSSPHFDDQAQRYVDRQFKDVAYYREDIKQRARRTYKPGIRSQ
ncbi:MAG: penicillin acylase family protein, partial [Acidobacteriota bacterium]